MLEVLKYVTSSDDVFIMTLVLIIAIGWAVGTIIGSFKK